MRRKDIAIVGLDCVFPGARSAREFWTNIVNEVDCISDRPAHRLPFERNTALPKDHIAYLATTRGGYLPADLSIDPLKFGIMPNAIKDGDADQFLMLKSIDAALADAGIAEKDPRRARTDVIIGRGGYPTYGQYQICFNAEWFDAFLETIHRKFPDSITAELKRQAEVLLRSTLPEHDPAVLSTVIPNITASRAANRLNLGGTAHTVDAACASSLIAVDQAVDRLRSGRSDVAVAGGFFTTQRLGFSHLFQLLSAISPSGMIRPMDRRADGLLLSEGGGAVILKRLEDAIEDGDKIYAIIKGAGTASDGRETDVLAPEVNGQVRALERAYQDADIDPETIGYLELHGTGTKAGDSVEIASLKKFFGEVDYPAAARAMGTVKSMIGHAMPASGIASLIRVALALSNKVLPPTLNCEQPHPDLEGSPFYVNSHTRPWIQSESAGPRRAGVNSFGFGGANVHCVVEEVLTPKKVGRTRKLQPRPIETMIRRPTEVALFTAPDAAAMKARLNQVLAFLDTNKTSVDLPDVAAALSRSIDIKQPCKLALIVADFDDLRLRIGKCLEQLDRDQPKFEDEQIYFSANAAKHEGKIAFIFPGMGFPGMIGNYPDHLIELCLHDPDVRAEFDFFEERDRHPDDHVPTSSVFCPPASLPEEYRLKLKARLAPPKTDSEVMYEQPAEERYLAAMGVTLANWVGWTMLKKLGIPVDMAAGQSQGEMAALCAAGICDFRGTAPAYWKALNINPRYSSRGRLAFVWGTEQELESMLKKYKDAYIAIHMSPEAVILGGERDALVEIMNTLKADGRYCQLFSYPPIHTPCLSHVKVELEEALAEMDFNAQKSKVTLYSSITAEPYPSDFDGIRRTLMMNVDQPLKIWQTVRRLYDDGARVLVQVGGGHMSAHLSKMLPSDGDVEMTTAALEVDTRNPVTQLNHLVSKLFTTGVPLNPMALFENRRLQDIDLEKPQTTVAAPRLLIPARLEWHPLGSPHVPAPVVEEVPEETVVVLENPPLPAEIAAESVEAVANEIISEPMEVAEEPGLDIELDLSLPVLGQNAKILRFVPEEELLIHRPLDFEQDAYIADHMFIYAPMRPMRENLPVIPMTMTMEFVAEIAGLLSPDRGLIGYENLRASRWIKLEDKDVTTLEISACVLGDDDEGVRRVEVRIDYEGKRAFSVKVLFAESYRHDLQLELPDMSDAGEWPFRTEEIYATGRLFHGPTFQTLVQLNEFGDRKATATLIAAPKDNLFGGLPEPTMYIDPCMFDACGQLVGLYCHTQHWFVLPTAVDKTEIYGPMPPAGTLCPVWLTVNEMNAETSVMRCDLVLGDGQGGVLARFHNWTDWMFSSSEKLHNFLCQPHIHFISTELDLPNLPDDAVCMWLSKEEASAIKFDWFPRTVLTQEEVDELRTIAKSSVQQEYVLSRLAAKDAARVWNSRLVGDRLRQTVEFQMDHDELGRPFLQSVVDETPIPNITLSHTKNVAIAVASSVPTGIDLEPANRDVSDILTDFATDEEQTMLETLAAAEPDGAWPLRLWCAKEAASKAQGTGLQGLPKRFQLDEVTAAGALQIVHTETQRRYVVETCFFDEWLIAVAQEIAFEPPAAALYDENAVIM